jgi:AcrR family transcriptional regulator
MVVEGASIRVIAKRAGYTAGAIYSYFDSKEAIYAALLRESLERLQQAVDAARASRARPDRSLDRPGPVPGFTSTPAIRATSIWASIWFRGWRRVA